MTRRAWTVAEVRGLGVTTDLTTAGSVLGIGRTKAQELARTGHWPTPLLRLGTQYRVPVLELLRAVGVEPPIPAAPEDPPGTTSSRPVRRPRHPVPPTRSEAGPSTGPATATADLATARELKSCAG